MKGLIGDKPSDVGLSSDTDGGNESFSGRLSSYHQFVLNDAQKIFIEVSDFINIVIYVLKFVVNLNLHLLHVASSPKNLIFLKISILVQFSKLWC